MGTVFTGRLPTSIAPSSVVGGISTFTLTAWALHLQLSPANSTPTTTIARGLNTVSKGQQRGVKYGANVDVSFVELSKAWLASLFSVCALRKLGITSSRLRWMLQFYIIGWEYVEFCHNKVSWRRPKKQYKIDLVSNPSIRELPERSLPLKPPFVTKECTGEAPSNNTRMLFIFTHMWANQRSAK